MAAGLHRRDGQAGLHNLRRGISTRNLSHTRKPSCLRLLIKQTLVVKLRLHLVRSWINASRYLYPTILLDWYFLLLKLKPMGPTLVDGVLLWLSD